MASRAPRGGGPQEPRGGAHRRRAQGGAAVAAQEQGRVARALQRRGGVLRLERRGAPRVGRPVGRGAGRAGEGARVLAGNELLILRLLREHGESHGMRIVALSDGALSQGTVYTTLARMQAKDYVESWLKRGVESGGPPLRVYRATAYGTRMLDAMEAFAAATARGG